MGATLDRLRREVRHAARRLVRTPVFTVTAILTLALAIGANAAIFAVVYRVVLNPLPYGNSGRLVVLDHGIPQLNVPSGVSLTVRLYHQYLDRARTLDGVAVSLSDERTLTGRGVPERVRVSRTTPSLARVLRIDPEYGRWFIDEEGAPGAPPVAVLSHRLWMRRYGQDAGMLDRQVVLAPLTVGDVRLRRYRAVSYSPNITCDLCCGPNVA